MNPVKACWVMYGRYVMIARERNPPHSEIMGMWARGHGFSGWSYVAGHVWQIDPETHMVFVRHQPGSHDRWYHHFEGYVFLSSFFPYHLHDAGKRQDFEGVEDVDPKRRRR